MGKKGKNKYILIRNIYDLSCHPSIFPDKCVANIPFKYYYKIIYIFIQHTHKC